MKKLSKSAIIQEITSAINHKKGLSQEYIEKASGKVIKVEMKIDDPPSFVDENGVRWVRG